VEIPDSGFRAVEVFGNRDSRQREDLKAADDPDPVVSSDFISISRVCGMELFPKGFQPFFPGFLIESAAKGFVPARPGEKAVEQSFEIEACAAYD
jgi:hypothetical protein